MKSVVVWHGGNLGSGEIRTPLFVTADFTQACGYADERRGSVYSFDLTLQNVADAEDIERAALGIGVTDWTHLYELISPNVSIDAERVIAELIRRGFKVARFWDFGFQSDFGEFEAFCVLDATALSAPTRTRGSP